MVRSFYRPSDLLDVMTIQSFTGRDGLSRSIIHVTDRNLESASCAVSGAKVHDTPCSLAPWQPGVSGRLLVGPLIQRWSPAPDFSILLGAVCARDGP
jgi:hypothetical protein